MTGCPEFRLHRPYLIAVIPSINRHPETVTAFEAAKQAAAASSVGVANRQATVAHRAVGQQHQRYFGMVTPVHFADTAGGPK